LARAKPAFPLGNEGALELRQQFTGIEGLDEAWSPAEAPISSGETVLPVLRGGQWPALDLPDLALAGVGICARKGVFEAHAPS
jgi:hypothetical protein